ncbi:MAG: DUF4831 family protein [Bacteroidales bacterium]
MKKTMTIAAVTLLLAGCAAPAGMQVRVAPLGEQVPESTELGVYVLPQTVLKVEMIFQEEKSVTGPFREYAEKYLGIKEVIRQNSSQWQILDMEVTPHQEMDPQMAFQLHLLDGAFNPEQFRAMIEKGAVMDGTGLVQEGIKSSAMGISVKKDYIQYMDLGIDSNFEERVETMYKTIVTDTSFVEVPVNRTITEQKSISVKAQEAADFILELRTRRFELLTGEYDGFPEGVAMKAALDKLDDLEASYLSLFTGKTLVRQEKKCWFIVPESGSESSTYSLGVFSEQLGFVPEEMMEGSPLKIVFSPTGETRNLDAYYSGQKTGDEANVLYYRIPDVVEMRFMLGNTELAIQRISVYQSGALIKGPL